MCPLVTVGSTGYSAAEGRFGLGLGVSLVQDPFVTSPATVHGCPATPQTALEMASQRENRAIDGAELVLGETL